MSYFQSPFRSEKNVRRGTVAKGMGDLFENMLRAAAIKDMAQCTRIPDGCRMVRTKAGAVIPKRTTTPFDFLITKNGLSACIDCKTVESGNFTFSMMTLHQVNSLIQIHDSMVPSGYLVWFRDKDQVIFFRADQLYHLKRRESLKPEDGINVGTAKNFKIQPILDVFKAKGT